MFLLISLLLLENMYIRTISTGGKDGKWNVFGVKTRTRFLPSPVAAVSTTGFVQFH